MSRRHADKINKSFFILCVFVSLFVGGVCHSRTMNITLTESELALLKEAVSAYAPEMSGSDNDTYSESLAKWQANQNKFDDLIALSAKLSDQ
jgi:hypothetical protein